MGCLVLLFLKQTRVGSKTVQSAYLFLYESIPHDKTCDACVLFSDPARAIAKGSLAYKLVRFAPSGLHLIRALCVVIFT